MLVTYIGFAVIQLSVIRTSAWNFISHISIVELVLLQKAQKKCYFAHALITIRLYFYLFFFYLQVGYPFETCYIFVRIEEYFDCFQ